MLSGDGGFANDMLPFESIVWRSPVFVFPVGTVFRWLVHVRIRVVNRFSETICPETAIVGEKIGHASTAKQNGG